MNSKKHLPISLLTLCCPLLLMSLADKTMADESKQATPSPSITQNQDDNSAISQKQESSSEQHEDSSDSDENVAETASATAEETEEDESETTHSVANPSPQDEEATAPKTPGIKEDELDEEEEANDADAVEETSPKRYIIQFEDGQKNTVLDALKTFKDVSIKYTYDQLFQGVAFELPHAETDRLKNLAGVKTLQESPAYRTAKPRQADSALQTLMTSPKFKSLHKNLDGRGLVIATIDSGLDLSHPDLRLDDHDPEAMDKLKIKTITPNGKFSHKVPHGFNYMRGDTDMIDRANAPHGMHIAGILAGNSQDPKGFKGIAPNAQLLTYKVFSEDYGNPDEYEYSGDDAVFHAMEDAVKRGADVISLSVGERGTGHPNDIFYQAVKRATDAGVIVVAAMGNYGAAPSTNTYDKYTDNSLGTTDVSSTVSVAANPLAIGVGSAQNPIVYLPTLTVAGKDYAYSNLSKHNDNRLPEQISHPLVYVNSKDSKTITENLSQKIVLVHRGGEAIAEKIRRLLGKGASGVIVINNPTEYSRGHFETHPIIGYQNLDIQDKWAISVSHQAGQELMKLATSHQSQQFSFNKEAVPHRLLDDTRISGFTSWGTTLDLELKPDLVAPGEDVYSLSNHGKYVLLSGTSMASPYVAGISALLSQHAKSLLHQQTQQSPLSLVELTKLLLMNTAKPVHEQEEANGSQTQLYHSPRQQGAGLTQFEEALKTSVLVTHDNKGAASLKEIGDVKPFTLTLRNLGDSPQTFTIKHGPVQGVTSAERIRLDESGKVTIQAIFPKAIPNATLWHPETISIAPHSEITIDLVLHTGQAKDEFVEGFIEFLSVDGKHPNLSIPYMGFKGAWHKEAILDAPAWDKASKTKLPLLFYPKYKTHDEFDYIAIGKENDGDTPNPELYALTTQPKDVNAISKVAPRYIFLRNAQDYDVAIVDRADDHAKVLRVLQTAHFANKYGGSIYREYELFRKRYETPTNETIWEGKFYNPKTGEEEAAPEGQYYYRLRARVTPDSPYQTLYIPIKVDNTRPTYDVTYQTDHQKLLVKPSDNHAIKTVQARVDYRKVIAATKQDQYYEIDLSDKKDDDLLKVEVFDQAGNSTEHQLTVSEWKKLQGTLHIVANDEEKETVEAKPTSPTSKRHTKVSLARHLAKSASDEDEEDWEEGEEYDTSEASDEEDDWEEDKEEDNSEDEDISDDEEDIDDEEGYEKNTFTLTNVPMYNILKYTYLDMLEDKHNNFHSVNDNNIRYKVPIVLKKGFRAEVTNTNVHYNKQQGLADAYQPFATEKASAQQANWQLQHVILPITDGSNQINIKVYQTIEGVEKLVFNKGYFLYLDTKKPNLELDTNPITFFDSTDDNGVNGTITAPQGKLKLTGKIKDNLDGWKLYVNNNMIDSRILTGEYGDNAQNFSYELEVEDNDVVKIHATDYLGNDIEYKFYARVTSEPSHTQPVNPNGEQATNQPIPNRAKKEDSNQVTTNTKQDSPSGSDTTPVEQTSPDTVKNTNNLKLVLRFQPQTSLPTTVDSSATTSSPLVQSQSLEKQLPQTGENLLPPRLTLMGIALSSLAGLLGITLKRKEE